MTPRPQPENEYTITEEKLQLLYRVTKSLRILGYSQKANMIEEVTDEVRPRPSPTPTEQEIREKVLKELIDWLVLYRIELEQHHTYSNLYHCNRFHIQLLKLLNHSTPTPEAQR